LTSKQPIYRQLDPKAYLDLARDLAATNDSAHHRSAADRAYYAAFLASRDELAKKGYLTPYNSQEDHRYVARTLKNKDVLGMYGNEEDRLRTYRNRVTYDTGDIIAGQAGPLSWMIETAAEIIRRVEDLPDK
jgi:hypothetical protein